MKITANLINLLKSKAIPDYFVEVLRLTILVVQVLLMSTHKVVSIFSNEKASIKKELHFAEYPAVDAGIVNWPMSDIRLTSTDTEQLIDLGTHIIKVWDQYSDESLNIKAFDGQARHHTVTPIMNRK